MNFPVNERKLREDLHEAIDKESMINVIILLMLIRVVQVITWLRPGEREIKRLKASNATVHLEDGTEFPGLDAMLNATEAAPEPAPDPYSSFGTMERARQARGRRESTIPGIPLYERDTNWELDVIAQSANELPTVDEYLSVSFPFLAKCVTTSGQARVLHRTPRGPLTITAHEGDQARIEAREISAVYMNFLIAQDNEINHGNRRYSVGNLVAASMEIEGQTIERDMNLEFDVAQSAHEEPETGRFPGHPERMALVYRNLAFCVTDCGEIQVLHRTGNHAGNRSLRISVYEGGREEEMEIPKIPAAYMVFLVEQDDASRNRRHQPGAIPGLLQDYTRDHFGRPVTGQQVVDLAHALDVEGPIDLSEHVGMSLQFSNGLRIRIKEDNLGYCQAMAEQERTAVSIENAIANYRWEIAGGHPNVLPIPMLLAWATTPGNEVATLEIGTDGVLIIDILEKTPKEAALESPEITMTYLRLLYGHEGHLHPTTVSGYCTPSRDPITGQPIPTYGNTPRDVFRMRFGVVESSPWASGGWLSRYNGA